jgi:hypothetical protein
MPSEGMEIFENAEDSLSHGIAHFLLRHENPAAVKHAILYIHTLLSKNAENHGTERG